ncbi:MAG: aldo/keto reductase [Proteobacteria bacterium]|nr:aldo/keto reductase [Pseudomonadota bacterium]
MPLDHFVTLGRSGLRVSPLCLGTMTFGEEWGWGASVDESNKILDAYLDRGGNFIDTANIYTKGHSEKIIGDHLGRHSARRHRAVIATKFFGNLYRGDPNGGSANRKSIISACENSLRRLQTDYIDLYWMHAWDPLTPIEETMRALDDLVDSGKVRYIGFSDTPAWKCAEAQTIARFRGWAPLIALQIEYSLLERTVEGDLVPMALDHGLGITPWSPLKGGALTGKYRRGGNVQAGRGERVTAALTDKTYDIVDALVEIAERLGTTPSRVALAWLSARSGVASPIIGARTLAQLDDNLGALDVKLTSEMAQKLDALSVPALNFPAGFLNYVSQVAQGGTTVNGVSAEPWPLSPVTDAERH